MWQNHQETARITYFRTPDKSQVNDAYVDNGWISDKKLHIALTQADNGAQSGPDQGYPDIKSNHMIKHNNFG